MRRPLPPELIELGDHLEGAVRRKLGERATRRQMFLNAGTAVLVALPLIPAVLGSTAAPILSPPVVIVETRAYRGAGDDFPPRSLSGPEGPAASELAEPTTMRRAMR